MDRTAAPFCLFPLPLFPLLWRGNRSASPSHSVECYPYEKQEKHSSQHCDDATQKQGTYVFHASELEGTVLFIEANLPLRENRLMERQIFMGQRYYNLCIVEDPAPILSGPVVCNRWRTSSCRYWILLLEYHKHWFAGLRGILKLFEGNGNFEGTRLNHFTWTNLSPIRDPDGLRDCFLGRRSKSDVGNHPRYSQTSNDAKEQQ